MRKLQKQPRTDGLSIKEYLAYQEARSGKEMDFVLYLFLFAMIVIALLLLFSSNNGYVEYCYVIKNVAGGLIP